MLRAQTLVTLKEYQSALFDVTRLMELNPDSEVYQNLEARLRTQLSLAPIPESEAELEEESDVEQDAEDKESREVELGVNERRDKRFESVVSLRRDLETTGEDAINKGEVVAPKTPEVREQNSKEVPMSGKQSNAWQAIPKPKGHSTLDYARWNTVEDDSSEEEDDEDSDDSDESPPQYRFREQSLEYVFSQISSSLHRITPITFLVFSPSGYSSSPNLFSFTPIFLRSLSGQSSPLNRTSRLAKL
jgi:hypothetical protein